MKPRIAAFTLFAIASSVSAQLAVAQGMDESSDSDSYSNQSAGQSPGIGAQSGTDVMHIQQSLKDKGFNVGRVDGVMGKKTRSALKSFQKEQGLNSTGTIDAPTLAALGVSSQRQAAGQTSEMQQHMGGGTSGRSHARGPHAKGGSPTPSYGASEGGAGGTTTGSRGGESDTTASSSGSTSGSTEGNDTTSSSGGASDSSS